jgi:hypothetical protein
MAWQDLIRSLGTQNAPFGFGPDVSPSQGAVDPAYNAGMQMIGNVGMGMLASGEANPMRALGRSYLNAQNQAQEQNKNQYIAAEMMSAAEEKKQKRQQEAELRQKRNDWLKSVSDPNRRSMLEAYPELTDEYIQATDPLFKDPIDPSDRYKVVGNKIYDVVDQTWIEGSGNGWETNLPKGYRSKADGSGAELIPGVNLPGGTLNATVTKELFEADETASAADNVIQTLNSILAPDASGVSLNDRAGSGALSEWQAFAARNDPTGLFDDKKGEATTELRTAITEQALQSLKAIFGGNPTEGERLILLDLQASVDKTPTERKIIVNRAKAAAKRRLDFSKNKATAIRNRSYTDPGFDPTGNQPVGSVDGYTIELAPEE